MKLYERSRRFRERLEDRRERLCVGPDHDGQLVSPRVERGGFYAPGTAASRRRRNVAGKPAAPRRLANPEVRCPWYRPQPREDENHAGEPTAMRPLVLTENGRLCGFEMTACGNRTTVATTQEQEPRPALAIAFVSAASSMRATGFATTLRSSRTLTAGRSRCHSLRSLAAPGGRLHRRDDASSNRAGLASDVPLLLLEGI